MAYFFVFNKLGYVQSRTRDTGCILCHIAQHDGTVPELVLWEDETFMVSVNLYPYNPGHLLLFPRHHMEDIRDLTGEQQVRLIDLTRACLTLLDHTYHPSGYNVGFNMGLCAGASIPHLHQHIIPRFPNEIGIGELLGGNRILVEDPRRTLDRLKETAREEGLFPPPS